MDKHHEQQQQQQLVPRRPIFGHEAPPSLEKNLCRKDIISSANNCAWWLVCAKWKFIGNLGPRFGVLSDDALSLPAIQ